MEWKVMIKVETIQPMTTIPNAVNEMGWNTSGNTSLLTELGVPAQEYKVSRPASRCMLSKSSPTNGRYNCAILACWFWKVIIQSLVGIYYVHITHKAGPIYQFQGSKWAKTRSKLVKHEAVYAYKPPNP